ncbi:MAG: PilZ domain-containing protein, partial [Gammaproteobacteria bacterium]|nr:PilZ domain-containing protein [Gammaproteobacteria bacterium]
GSGKKQRKTKRLKLFNAVCAHVIFQNGKYKGSIDDISQGGCMVNLPILSNGGTIFDECIVRIGCDEKTVDIPSELIRLERDTSIEDKKVNAAFIFKKMSAETQKKFDEIWKKLDKSMSAKKANSAAKDNAA